MPLAPIREQERAYRARPAEANIDHVRYTTQGADHGVGLHEEDEVVRISANVCLEWDVDDQEQVLPQTALYPDPTLFKFLTVSRTQAQVSISSRFRSHH